MFEPTQKVCFKTAGDVDLQMHIFKPEAPAEPAPAIVFFYGGGWKGGEIAQFYPHSDLLSSRGVIAICAEYRVEGRHGTSPFECVADGKSALRYVRSNAETLGIDPSRIAVGGGSAGGHVAAATVLIPNLDDPQDDLSVPTSADAMVLFNPVVDTSPHGYGYDRLRDRYREISPIEHVTADAPPACVFHGTADETVPFENARHFAAKLKEAGVRCELHPYEGAGHGFFNYNRDREIFRDTCEKMIRFLQTEGFIPE